MDYQELKVKTIAELREFATGVEGLTGYTQMRKDKLLETICEHLNIALHDQHRVVGVDKSALKREIRALKAKRDEALNQSDRAELVRARRKIHRLKRRLRRATV